VVGQLYFIISEPPLNGVSLPQSFQYQPGLHNVWQLPADACDFSAINARLVSNPSSGSYITTLTNPGVYVFACGIPGHCLAGMKVIVHVSPATDTVNVENSASILPPAGEGAMSMGATHGPSMETGYCSSPAIDSSGYTLVSCLSPPLSLAPGDNFHPEILLPNPYPSPDVTPQVLMHTLRADIVDSTGRSIPLSEVYLHHTFGDIRFVPGEGAEIRETPTRYPLPSPYIQVINTTQVADPANRYANIHMINTVGVSPQDLKPCIECWCSGTWPPQGSIGCCRHCPSNSSAPAKDYFIMYNVSYWIPSSSQLLTSEPVTAVVVDVHGDIEYDIAPENGTNPLSVSSHTYALDYFCPQDGPYQLIKCWGHQHIGGRCIRVTDVKTGALICESCPVYGNDSSNPPGNEKGYLVGMSATVHDPPVTIQPGQQVHIEAIYDASEPYGGVMSLLEFVFANITVHDNCSITPAGILQPPITEVTKPSVTLANLLKMFNGLAASCQNATQTLKDAVLPCFPVFEAMMSNVNASAADTNTCCKATRDNPIDTNALENILNFLDSHSECRCPVGDIIYFAAQNSLIKILNNIESSCNQDVAGNVVLDIGAYYALDGFFVPYCPSLKQELAGAAILNNDTVYVSATASPPKTNSTPY